MRDALSLKAIFLIHIIITVVISVPVDQKVETKNENVATSSSKNTQNLQSVIEGINLTPIIETVVKNVVPKMVLQKEFLSRTNSNKDESDKLQPALAENISQNIQSILKSTIKKENIKNLINLSNGQKLITSSGLQQEPSLFKKLVEVIIESVKYATTVVISKIDDIGNKGLMRTVSETITLQSRDLDSSIQSTQNKETENEVSMQTRDLSDIFPGFKRSDHRKPWYSGFYHDYGHDRNPYYAGPFGYIWMIIENCFMAIRNFWTDLTHGPRPMGYGFSGRRW